MRGACPQCGERAPWRKRLISLVCWWSQWRCGRCGAWVEVRLAAQMALLYGLIPAAAALLLLRHWPRMLTPRGWRVAGTFRGWAPWAGLGLALVWVWLTSRLAVAHESSTHCHRCGYPLPPLADQPPQTARVCPECGAKS